MIVRVQTQCFLRHQFEREQQLRPVRQQEFHIRAGESHHHFGIFEIGMDMLAFGNLEAHVKTRVLNNSTQEGFNGRSDTRDGILFLVQRYFFFFGASMTGAGVYLLIKYCCAMPTKLPVSQYNTRPLGML